MRGAVKRRLVWIVFVVVLVWALAFVLTRFFIPEIMEVSEFENSQGIKEALTSGMVLGTLATILILIIGAIVVDFFIARKHRN